MKNFDEIIKYRKKKKTFEEIISDRNSKNKVSEVAPIKTTITEKGEERTWFKSSDFFDDGYDFGDITKTVIGTVGDINAHLTEGFAGVGEKIIDAGAMLGAAMNQQNMNQAAESEMIYNFVSGKEDNNVLQRYQNYQDEVEKETAEFVKKDLYNEEEVAKFLVSAPLKTSTGIDTEKHSVMGEKSDSLATSAGELGATVALQSVGVPWWLTTGSNAFGGEAESALNEGATFDEAMLSASVTAGAEILTEKISGGISFGGTTLDDELTKELARGISNKTVRTLAKLGIDTAGEGGEEVLSGVMSALGQKLTYADDKEMSELFSSEEAFESFIGGAVLGGSSGVVNAVKSKINGVDYASGLTNDEKEVVDKVYKDEIAEAEQDGKKLTQREKSKIYDEVMDSLEKGQISTDTIEEVLGGETYSTYKSAVDNETTLQKEYDTLNKMKYGDMTGEQIDRRAELKQQLDELKANTNTADMKTKLGDKVFSLVKDSKLAESYNEKSRRGQALEVDLSQYEEKYHTTLKKAAESGILNNTNKTHDFVDLLAKISADKNATFDFTDNQRLKDSGFAIEGKTVNGYITESGDITVNINSAKALNRVVGHEVTHVLEGTELYDILAQSVTEYAKSKGEYDSRLETLTKLYEGVEGANVDAELVADLVGDYVFTDADFVRKLSAENRNVFQKIYDEIKYLCKVATAGSKEARQLEKVKKTFAEVYRESNTAQKNTAENSGVRYSLGDTEIPTRKQLEDKGSLKIVDISIAKTKGTYAERRAQIKQEMQNIISKPYLNKDTQTMIFLTNKSYEHAFSNSGGIQLNAAEHLPELIENAVLTHAEENTHGSEYATGVYTFFAAAKADKIRPVKLKVKEFSYKGQELPKNIKEYFAKNPQDYAASYDTVVLEVEEIEESSIGSVKDIDSNSLFLDPNELSEISIADLLNLVNGSAKKYVPDNSGPNTEKSNDNSNDLAPVKKSLSEQGSESDQYGDYNVSGEDVMLELPVRDDIAKTEIEDDVDLLRKAFPKRKSVKTDLEKAVANYVESNIEDIENDLNNEVLSREPKNIFAGTRKGYVRRLSDGTYESGVFGEGSGIVLNENIIRTDSLEEAITAQYKYMLENSNGDISNTIQKHANNYDNTRKAAEEDITPVKEEVLKSESVGEISNNVGEFSDMDEYFKWLLDEQSGTKNNAPVGAENVADSDEADRVSSLLDIDGEEADRVATLLDSKSAKSESDGAASPTIKTVEDRIAAKLDAAETALENNRRLQQESAMEFDNEIAQLQKEYEAKKNKNTKVANNILRRIERLQQLKGNVDADYAKRINDLEAQVEKLSSPTYKVAEQRRAKQEEYFNEMEELVGDTTTWKDKKIGLSYMVNTLRRNLRDIVRDKNGNRDVQKADEIYDVLQGSYNRNEATLKREANRIKKVYAEMEINSAEDKYIQMLGELRHNPNTTLTEDEVEAYYQKHKNRIDTAKVDEAINLARKTYDELLIRVNKVLKEQGMKQIPHREGYFPHFTEEKQGFLGKLFNWKTQNNDIPTDIAGLTENFNPDRSWQSFNKQRTTDDTDYSFLKGMDSYVQGSLDWIYHIEDIQKRRAFENYIRYVHSEQGVKDKVEAIRNNEEYDADEAQEQIDLVYKEAANPLNNFVTDFRTATNTLAGKKSSLDRGVETATNRKIYSVMTNISNRVSANMVAGSISSALTNFIPITQSWAQVSPVSSLKAMGQTLKSIIRNDGVVEKSDFLTNRLNTSENLYKTTWDKIIDKAGILMEGVDSFTSQTVWRSKYLENIKKGMSESEAIKNADQFAENVIAGRSRGNQPTAFDAKNPLAKLFTTFQLEVNNQYGYMFKDVPQDVKSETKHWKANLAKGYATMFIGAYAYNALYSALVGRDAAFDPIGIVEDLLRDLGVFGDDEEEEPQEVIMNLADNIIDELPFVGGVLGDGGRIPLSSVLPYDNGVYGAFEGIVNDVAEGNWDSVKSEIGNSFVSYLVAPAGGGQIKKTVQGLSMFNTDEEHPIAGSYTDSGDLRFPVDDTLLNRVQAGLFGQWANENAQDYIENGRKPLNEKQIQEFIDVDLPIADYWKYRDGLKGLDKLNEKGDYIGGLDLPASKKNILINNIADRKEDIDMTDYNKYPSFEEFDYAQKNPEKYEFLKSQGVSVSEYENFDEDTKEAYSWAAEYPEKFQVSRAVTSDIVEYKSYTKTLSELKADKDKDGNSISGSRKEKVVEYINDLDINYGAKIILYRSQYKSDNTYNRDIVEYLNDRDDISYKQMETILKELGFEVDSKGNIYWD